MSGGKHSEAVDASTKLGGWPRRLRDLWNMHLSFFYSKWAGLTGQRSLTLTHVALEREDEAAHSQYAHLSHEGSEEWLPLQNTGEGITCVHCLPNVTVFPCQ